MNVLYRQNDFPVFQNWVYDTAEEARHCPRGDIKLVEDLRTGLVRNAAFKAELMTYDSFYQNEQAVSQVFQHHLEEVAALIERTMGRDRLIEIGCGKGFFLEFLAGKGFNVAGFDPAYEGCSSQIRKEYFTHEAMIPCHGFILRHVLEHIENPIEFLGRLKTASRGQERKIYIEVPCFNWICDHKAWFDIFYEHVNYFRLSDFKRMFGKILDAGKLFGGQYLYVTADLSSFSAPEIDTNDMVIFPDNFLNISFRTTENEKTAVWGGSSKGVVFALLMQRMGHPVSMVIDINPAKQGRYLPATGLRVCSPHEGKNKLSAGSVIYVMNSNYLDEIKNMSENKYVYLEAVHG